MNILFVSDSFIEQNPCGGAERADQVIIDKLRKSHNLTQILSNELTVDILNNKYDKIIISNFTGLSSYIKNILTNYKYSIIEHDFKMLIGRNPNFYENLIAPKSHIVNQHFYRKARKVIFQSKRHLEVAINNLPLENAIVCGNAWDQGDLVYISSLINVPKEYDAAVLNHPYPNKNTAGSIEYCKRNNIKYLEIPRCNYKDYILQLSRCKSLVFFPTIFETYSRVAAEARCLGLELITNEYTSFVYEPCFQFSGLELIDKLQSNADNLISFLLLND